MTPTDLAALVHAVATDVFRGRGLSVAELPSTVELSRPRNPAHGDYATSVALRAAKRVGVPPLELAGWLVSDLATRAGITAAEVAGPGFINLRLAPPARGAVIDAVLAAGAGYGAVDDFAERERGPETPRRVGPVRPAHLTPARAESVRQALVRITTGMDDVVPAQRASAPPEISPETRYALLRAPVAAVLNLEPDLLATPVDANPGYRVRFAYACLAALARHAADLGMSAGDRYELLEAFEEAELIGALGDFPEAVRASASSQEPCRVARYLENLVTTYHRFADVHRVLPMGDEPISERSRARLALCLATRQVLGNGLRLLGVNAPERM